MRASNVQYHVYAEGHYYVAVVRGKLKKGKATTTNLVAVGDDVWITPTSPAQAVIERIEERHSKVSRRSPGRIPREQIIAVNVDYGIIVMASHAPDFNKNRLDRYIAACRMGNVRPVICINKIDLADESYVQGEMALYENLGYVVMYTSAKTGQGLEQLRAVMKDHVSVVVGSSGVGKSSLINAVQPDLGLKTKVLREGFWKGQHTTTTAELLTLDMGGMVVDTPGMREFALWHEDGSAQEDVTAAFPDIEEAASHCRFRNCSHTHEPGCAVKRLVDEGEIDLSRYKNYAKLVK